MDVKVGCVLIPAGRNVLARAESVNLAALGSYSAEAIASLVEGVRAWCGGLREVGVLEETLARRGIEWSGASDGDLRVIPVIAQDQVPSSS